MTGPVAALHGALELVGTSPLAGVFTIENHGDRAVRLWRLGSSCGDRAVCLHMRADGEDQRITKAPQIYTRNAPSGIDLSPGARHQYEFDLGDGNWRPRTAVARLSRPGAQLRAVYDSGDSPERRTEQITPAVVRTPWTSLECPRQESNLEPSD